METWIEGCTRRAAECRERRALLPAHHLVCTFASKYGRLDDDELDLMVGALPDNDDTDMLFITADGHTCRVRVADELQRTMTMHRIKEECRRHLLRWPNASRMTLDPDDDGARATVTRTV